MSPQSATPPARRGLGPLWRLLGYVAVLVGGGEVLVNRIPAADGWAIFGEYGRIETAQVALLVLGIVLALLLGRRDETLRGFGVVVAGLLVALLVREHNNLFKDHVGGGAWQALVAVVIAVTAVLAWPRRRTLGPSIASFVHHRAFAWVGAGVVLVGFAQLLDEEALWRLVLETDAVPYTARRVAEESLELLAYAFGSIGLFEFLLDRPRRANASEPSDQSSTTSSV